MIKHIPYKIIIAFCFCVLLACGKEKTTNESAATPADSTSTSATNLKPEDAPVDFSGFRLGYGKLGPIMIGSTVKAAEQYLATFKKEKCPAYNFGFDGGGDAYLYSHNNKPVLAIVPEMDSDKIIAIVAIDEKIQGENGLHPGMTAKEVVGLYPKAKVNFNQMIGWEDIYDRENGWEIVFDTDEKNAIGVYKDGEESAVPKRLAVASKWITLHKPESSNPCDILKGGKFTYKDPDGDIVNVSVADNVITEQHKGDKYTILSQMKWTGDCTYQNMLMLCTIPGFKLPPGTVMEVIIDKVEGSNVYFTATTNGKSYHNMFTKI